MAVLRAWIRKYLFWAVFDSCNWFAHISVCWAQTELKLTQIIWHNSRPISDGETSKKILYSAFSHMRSSSNWKFQLLSSILTEWGRVLVGATSIRLEWSDRAKSMDISLPAFYTLFTADCRTEGADQNFAILGSFRRITHFSVSSARIDMRYS